MNHRWYHDAVFYHLYPLGLCAAPERNDFRSPPARRLEVLFEWVEHVAGLGLNALYLGPVFESTAHGYDTADYFSVDRRLGDANLLKQLTGSLKDRGLRVVFDGVFNHVGRDFWAFRDLREKGEGSAYASWFHNLDFSRSSPYGDRFAYEGWHGHLDLVKLNLANPEVRRHLFDAVSMWIAEFDIDGLRLDAADQIDPDFHRALAAHCKAIKPDFWLMGEIVAGDYRRWLHEAGLDSVTNYECYKGLYSSHVDRNYFEIAYSLNRQFGPQGIYRGSYLYNFADNHDVDRVASRLSEASDLYPLHILLFTMPGVPSIYYGSEWGVGGRRGAHSDADLRPALDLSRCGSYPHPDLAAAVRRLAALRSSLPALRHGDYAQLHVDHRQLAFGRRTEGCSVVVMVNAAEKPASVPAQPGRYQDALNQDEIIQVRPQRPGVTVQSKWGRILVGR
jgi:cyclomaltodextrinase